MKLHELIKTNNWLSVELTLISIYPDQEKSINAYQKIFTQLQQTTAIESEIQILLSQYFEDEKKQESNIDVSVLKKNNQNDLLTESLAIEFMPWREWLGMTISEKTLEKFNELEIISHCLYEMTFVGYNEEEIQKQFSEIRKTVKDYKNMTDEEKKKNTKSLDDLLSELDDK